jgi:hypothetical protein
VSDDELGAAPISIPAAARGRVRPFEPIDLVVVNDAVVRIAAIEGAFQDREPVEMVAGDLYVVPRGIEHRPVADRRAVALLLERPETLQYGN